MLESHEGNLVDGDMAGAEPPFLVLRVNRFILHFLAGGQGSSAPQILVREAEGRHT